MRRWIVLSSVLLVWALTATIVAVVKSGSGSVVGSWAEWATATITLLALIAAAWAGFAAQGQLRAARGQLALMQAESAARTTESLERQARQVFPLHLRSAADYDGDISHHILVDNRSNEPITRVEAYFIGPYNTNGETFSVIPGTTRVEAQMLGEMVRQSFETLAEKVTFPGDEERSQWVRMVAGTTEWEFALVFTDARGQRWLRTADSTLIPKPESYGGPEAQDELMALSRFAGLV